MKDLHENFSETTYNDASTFMFGENPCIFLQLYNDFTQICTTSKGNTCFQKLPRKAIIMEVRVSIDELKGVLNSIYEK